MSVAAKPPGRKLVSMAVRPGIALYVGNCTYPESLHAERHKKLRMWDVGPYALVQSVDPASGEVTDEIEVMWHSVWWRKAAK